jgi:hypothetical protein
MLGGALVDPLDRSPGLDAELRRLEVEIVDRHRHYFLTLCIRSCHAYQQG